MVAARHALAGSPVPSSQALLSGAREVVDSAWGISASSLGFSLALGGSALLLGALSPAPWRRRLRFEPSPLGWGELGLALLGFLALSTVSDSAFRLLGLQDRGTIGRLVIAFEDASPGALVLGVLGVGLAAGTAEELFFRGFVQSRLVERWGRWAGVALTALAFGVYHLDALQGGFAVAIGLYLGWLTDRAGSVRPAAAAHVVNNSAWVLSTALLPQPGPALDVGLLLLSLGVSAGATLLLYRRLASRAVPAAARRLAGPE
ncbi:MAG TPA: CPBP family intramembrane glutamic endopeptidase [Anaeromyxobacteraceae bacterium]|nr:CPBP family intramembrane glutamic endopeptidase [Anaeromyxobacteraceae bacterium]